jgi:hypothetical protein
LLNQENIKPYGDDVDLRHNLQANGTYKVSNPNWDILFTYLNFLGQPEKKPYIIYNKLGIIKDRDKSSMTWVYEINGIWYDTFLLIQILNYYEKHNIPFEKERIIE